MVIWNLFFHKLGEEALLVSPVSIEICLVKRPKYFFKEVAVKQNKQAVPGQTIWEQLAVLIWLGDHVAQPI